MNQILAFRSVEGSKKQIKRVIKFFCFFVIIFSLILIAEGVLGYLKNKNKKVDINTPEVNISRNGDITILNIYSDIGVQKILYSWNDGLENTIQKTGEKELSAEISTTIGINDLNVKIIDSDGNIITYDPIKIIYEQPVVEENWEVAITTDITEPTISLSATKGKVVINVSDDVKMSYITYSWNGGEETKITGLSSDEKLVTAEIDVMKGDNKLLIKAYDKAGNVKELEKDVHGTDGPQIKVTKEADEIIVKITDEYEITKIEYDFNGEIKTIDNINEKSYEMRLKLIDGDNYIIVSAYEGNVKSEYKGKTKK